MKNRLIGTVAALALGAAGAAFAADNNPVGPDKVIYHVNDTATQASNALRNISNHLEVNPQAKIVVVTHAGGVDMLLNEARDKNGNPYNIPIEQLNMQGVKFEVCRITLRNRKLEKSQFIPEASFVPSGVAEIARLQQREGYAYLRP